MQRHWLTIVFTLFLMACTDAPLVERWALYYTPYTEKTTLQQPDYIGLYESKQQCEQGGVDQVLQHRGTGNFKCIVSFSHPAHPNHKIPQQ